MYFFMLLFWYVSFTILGAIVGSFLNASIWRVREGIPISKGRSLCPHCRHTLQARDLVPIFSYMTLGGQCRYCKKHISEQYPIVELATGILFLLVAVLHRENAFFPDPELIRDLVAVSLLVFIFVYDFLYMEILDRATTVPAALFFIAGAVYGWLTWQSMLIGIVIGAGFFLVQYVVSKGRWIGGGDIRLGLFMGVILGFPRILLALFLAYIIGAAVSLFLIAMKKKQLASETPFGTYLAIATGISLFWGRDIIHWYVGLIGF